MKSISRQGVETTGAVRKHNKGVGIVIGTFPSLLILQNLISGTTDLDSGSALFYD